MSERMQHTAISMREQMLRRYGDEFHHKHDKNHLQFRQHCRTHPVKKRLINGLEEHFNTGTGHVREWNLRKLCKQKRGHVHW